jgi:hypothetical protein
MVPFKAKQVSRTNSKYSVSFSFVERHVSLENFTVYKILLPSCSFCHFLVISLHRLHELRMYILSSVARYNAYSLTLISSITCHGYEHGSLPQPGCRHYGFPYVPPSLHVLSQAPENFLELHRTNFFIRGGLKSRSAQCPVAFRRLRRIW